MATEPRTDPPSAAAAAAAARNGAHAPAERVPVDRVAHPEAHPPVVSAELTETERRLVGDLFAIVEEHADDAAVEIDRERVEDAFLFSCEHHADQRRKSGEEFIVHPVGVAKICAGMRLDTETLCAALLHDTVEDTSASLDEVRDRFGDEVATLVDGVTKLTGITFTSRDEAQAENYRKMMVAMATDIRVILIKLADRLHNMRTIGALPKQKQIDKAKETLEIYAPIAHRLGIHAIKWELEDLAFAALHPRKYQEIKGLVNQQREEREDYVHASGAELTRELDALGIHAEIAGRREALLLDLLEDDQEGPRVQRDLRPHRDARHRRLGEGLLRRGRRHPLAVEAAARALQGLRRDAEVQHVPVTAHDGDRARGAAARDPDPHARDARHGRVRRRRALDLQGGLARQARRRRASRSSSGCGRCSTGSRSSRTPRSSWRTSRSTSSTRRSSSSRPRARSSRSPPGATPLDFAYEIHTELGHRCVGAKVNGKIVPLNYPLKSGDIVEVLTSKRERGPSRDWLARGQDDARAQQDQAVVQAGVARGHRAHRPRAAAGAPQQGRACPPRRSPARRCWPT